MELIHLELAEANEYVAKNHRHHFPVTGHRFSIGAVHGNRLVGAAIVGRPVARNTDRHSVVEVLRCCTDGTKNACSFLYGAAARAAIALGYRRIQTYVLEVESGRSLVAAGWTKGHTTAGGSWNGTTRRGRREDQPMGPKTHWYRDLQ